MKQISLNHMYGDKYPLKEVEEKQKFCPAACFYSHVNGCRHEMTTYKHVN